MSTSSVAGFLNAEEIVIETFTVDSYTNQGNGGTTLNLSNLAGISSTDDVISLTQNADASDEGLSASEILTVEVNSVTDNGVEIIARTIDADATTPAWAEVANTTDIGRVTLIAKGN